MHRRSLGVAGVVPVALAGLVGIAVLALPALAEAQSNAPGMVVKVSPDHGLRAGQIVKVTGRGLPKSSGSTPWTWFVTECTAAVRGRVNPETDTPHCDISHAQALKVSSSGSFSVRYHLTAGIIGDGYCGTTGHATCIIGVGTAQGLGRVVRITFKVPPASPPALPPADTGGGADATTATTAAG